MNLELKNLAPYLPYSLKVESQRGTGDLDYKGLKKGMTCFNIHKIDGDKWKPLLLPLTALTQQLPDGSIPIVELAKIAKFSFIESDKINITDVAINIRDDKYLFGFNFNWNSFHSYSLCDQNPINVKHQLQLFEYLFKNHFDVFGLIDKGLAAPLI